MALVVVVRALLVIEPITKLVGLPPERMLFEGLFELPCRFYPVSGMVKLCPPGCLDFRGDDVCYYEPFVVVNTCFSSAFRKIGCPFSDAPVGALLEPNNPCPAARPVDRYPIPGAFERLTD